MVIFEFIKLSPMKLLITEWGFKNWYYFSSLSDFYLTKISYRFTILLNDITGWLLFLFINNF